MKLHALREHFVVKEGETDWTPKKGFETEEEIKQELPSIRWKAYTCSICGKLHVTDTMKRKNNNVSG